MTSRIRAINAVRPKIEHGKTVEKRELNRYIARVTNLSEGQIDLVVKELRDAIIFFNLAGRGVKVDGLGIFKGKISLDGELGMQFKLSPQIKKELQRDQFTGTILNADRIGLSSDDLVAIWDKDNPTDTVQ